jgi:hypothetical protein
MCAGTHYAELVFSHLVGFEGHVVHSGVSELKSVDVLFFMFGWARCGVHKKHAGTRYAALVFFCIRWDLRVTKCILVHPGRETSSHHFHA